MNLVQLRRVVEGRDTPAGRIFDFIVQLLILVSLVSFSIETLPNLSEQAKQKLRIIEVGTVAIFTIEYLLRLIVAKKKLRFVFSFYGLVDLIAILPFYISTGVDLRSIRVLRFLRAFRVLKFARYSRAIRLYGRAFSMIKDELLLFFTATLLLFYVSAVGIYYFEREAQPEAFASVFHGMWWAVVTLTTVGYGGVIPITVGGRIFTFVILMIGLGVVAVPTGLMASALSEARRLESAEGSEDISDFGGRADG